MLSAIGNTPLVRLSRIVPQGAADSGLKYLAGDLYAAKP